MKTQNKKGFTIVELVIVIAVIAILAAVLIPTFINLTKKANESADIQACRQMNTQLAINEVLKGKSITEVHAALKSGGMDTENYTPLVEGHYFFWDSELNRVLYVDADNKVLYPEEYKNTTGAKGQRLSLNGKIGMKEVNPSTDGVYSISTAEELYWLSEKNRKTKDAVIIKFKDGEIDLKGADIGFRFITTGKATALTCSIEGKEGSGTTLYGLAQITHGFDGEKGDNIGKDYASGLVQHVKGNVTITIRNITIENASVGNPEIGCVGAVVGRIEAEWSPKATPTVTLENVTVKNSVVNGKNKVGGLIGGIGTATITIRSCKVENVTVNCSEGESGKAIGCLYGENEVTIDRAFNEWVSNTTLNLIKGDYTRNVQTLTNCTVPKAQLKGPNAAQDAEIPIVADTQLVQKLDSKGMPTGTEYRVFHKDAYMTLQLTGSRSSTVVEIGSQRESITFVECKDGADNTKALFNGGTYRGLPLHIFQ